MKLKLGKLESVGPKDIESRSNIYFIVDRQIHDSQVSLIFDIDWKPMFNRMIDGLDTLYMSVLTYLSDRPDLIERGGKDVARLVLPLRTPRSLIEGSRCTIFLPSFTSLSCSTILAITEKENDNNNNNIKNNRVPGLGLVVVFLVPDPMFYAQI